MNKWLESYANHFVYASLYTGVASYTLKLSRSMAPLPWSGLLSSSPSPLLSSSSSSSSSSSVSWNILPLIATGVAALGLYTEINYIIKRIGLPPGSSGYPLLGHLSIYINNPRSFFTRHRRKFGDICTLNFLMVPTVLVSSDEDVQWANIQERKGALVPWLPGFIEKLVGEEGIVLQASKNHRRLRRIFEPSFSPTVIQAYAQTIDDISKGELKEWSKKGDFCNSDTWAILAMRLFFACSFGEVEESVLVKINSLFKAWVSGFKALVLIPLPGNCLYNAYVARGKLYALLQDMVDKFKNENPPGSDGAKDSMMGRLCYGIDDDGKQLTNSQLVTNIAFVLFAGHDTTKGSFCNFAHFLVHRPDLHNLLVQEVNGFAEPLDMNELKSAPLLNAFLAEAWRLAPPADAHRMKAVTDLEYKGYEIRNGVGVTVDITGDAVMNDRFVDPLEFRVERWLPKDHLMHDPKYYLDDVDYNVMSVKYRVFNMGAHMCLGAHFAKLEARIVLTRLLQGYDIKIQNETSLSFPVYQYSHEFKLTAKQN